MEDLTPIKIFGDGHTEPSVPFGTAILLIQNGKVRVGKLMQDQDEANSIFIDHPKNEATLEVLAQELIKKRKPKYLKSDASITLTCPPEIAKDMIW